MRLNFSARRLVNLLGNRRMKIHSDCTEMHAQIIFLDLLTFTIFQFEYCGFLTDVLTVSRLN